MNDTSDSSIERPRKQPEDGTDWRALGRLLQQIQNQLIHRDQLPRYGDDYYAESLRRLLTDSRCGFITTAEHQRLVDLHTQVDRRNLQDANRRAREARARYATASRKIRAELAGWLRRVANDRTVPSRYRREGVLLAADWLDPASSASPYPSTRSTGASPQPPPPLDPHLLQALRDAGGREGRLAGGWWQQHALTGRTRAEREGVARTVLDGIDSGDDAVLAGLPCFDVAGYDADRYQAHRPAGAPDWSDLAAHERALVIDAVRDGFTEAVRDDVAARCHTILHSDPAGEGEGVRR
ncbi:hypothetical protein [Micromonospora costi]|uniref:Uncharacterized protein n=1 Tax=Micromonospora costi TaxID=1530042 RepID=A0A3B0A466_9ACTN|nr:hypothetical protein [Micromonospora costi]RKN55271.1 hypothetical protein D7193_11275 [Micromonospora costi]